MLINWLFLTHKRPNEKRYSYPNARTKCRQFRTNCANEATLRQINAQNYQFWHYLGDIPTFLPLYKWNLARDTQCQMARLSGQCMKNPILEHWVNAILSCSGACRRAIKVDFQQTIICFRHKKTLFYDTPPKHLTDVVEFNCTSYKYRQRHLLWTQERTALPWHE